MVIKLWKISIKRFGNVNLLLKFGKGLNFGDGFKWDPGGDSLDWCSNYLAEYKLHNVNIIVDAAVNSKIGGCGFGIVARDKNGVFSDIKVFFFCGILVCLMQNCGLFWRV